MTPSYSKPPKRDPDTTTSLRTFGLPFHEGIRHSQGTRLAADHLTTTTATTAGLLLRLCGGTNKLWWQPMHNDAGSMQHTLQSRAQTQRPFPPVLPNW